MPIRPFPDIPRGGMPTAAEFNRLQDIVEQHSHLSGSANLQVRQGSAGFSVADVRPRPFTAVLTGVDTTHGVPRYGFREQQQWPDGAYHDFPDARTAAATDVANWAIDDNASASLPTDQKTVFTLLPSDAADFYRIISASPVSATASLGLWANLGSPIGGPPYAIYTGTLATVVVSFFGLPKFAGGASVYLWDFMELNPGSPLNGTYYAVQDTGLNLALDGTNTRRVYGIVGGWVFGGACNASLAQILLNTY